VYFSSDEFRSHVSAIPSAQPSEIKEEARESLQRDFPLQESIQEPITLKDKLLHSCLLWHNKDRWFLPQSSLKELINKKSIQAELDSLPSDSQPLVQISSTNFISDIQEKATRIFVILVLLNDSGSISGFIHEGITDESLPFQRCISSERSGRPNRRNTKLCLRTSGSDEPQRPIKPMSSWPVDKIEAFDREQWTVLCTIFEKLQVPIHYDFDNREVLPFVHDEEKESRPEHHAEVWKVGIHHSHQHFIKSPKQVCT
jgi:hypothetical protein